MSKFSNGKGPQEFTGWCYDLRRVVADDVNFHVFLKWLEEDTFETSDYKVTAEVLAKKSGTKRWNAGWLNSQLYGILAEATCGRAKNSVIAREHEKDINGADLYHGFAYQRLEFSQKRSCGFRDSDAEAISSQDGGLRG